MKTALVTGAAGFLGSHLVDKLLFEPSEEWQVIGIDNLMTGSLDNLVKATGHKNFHFIPADVRELPKVRADVIFNLACPASPVQYQADPVATITTSFLGALRVAELARETGARVVHASTSEVYGDPLEHPQKESYWGNVNPIGPRACYDEGKRAAEALFASYVRQWGLDIRVARIFNTYGPRMAADDGRVVSNFIVAALRGAPPTFYGSGFQTRSFCYVTDTVRALCLLAQDWPYEPADEELPIFNVGNPHEITIQQLAFHVAEAVGGGGGGVSAQAAVDDPSRRKPDITAIHDWLGWEPQVTLQQGLAFTVAYFRERVR